MFLCVAMHAIFYSIAYITHPKRIFNLIRNLTKKHFEPSNVFEQRLYDVFVREKYFASEEEAQKTQVPVSKD